MISKTRRILLFLFLFIVKTSQAQLVKIDTTFAVGTGANNAVNKIDIQTSGKIIVSGEFQSFNGKTNKRIVRVLPNGVIDSSYTTGTGFEGPVRSTFLQKDDKLLAGGLFNTYNNISSKNLVRLTADGNLDTSFKVGIGANNEVLELFVQHNDKILMAGFFSKYNNVSYNGFVRLNADGSIDTSFNLGTGTVPAPECFAQQKSNKILIGGAFVRYKGINVGKIFRVDENGNYDSTFNVGTVLGTVKEVLVLPDDKIIISGDFSAVQGKFANRVARLFSDGKIDTSFHGNVGGRIRDMHLQKDGKLILVGDFTTAHGQPVQRLLRLKTDGRLDSVLYAGTNGSINDVAEQFDKNILLGGVFTQTTQTEAPITQTTNRIVRINNNYTTTLPCVSATEPILDTNESPLVCKYQQVTIKVTGGSLNSGKSWYWYKDSLGSTLIDAADSIVVAEPRSRVFYVTAGLTCNDTVVKFATYKLNVNDTINTLVSVNNIGLEAMATGVKYQWHRCDSFVSPLLPGDTNKMYTPLVTAEYAVVINSNGCLDTSACVFYSVLPQSVESEKRLLFKNPVSAQLVLPIELQIMEMELVSLTGQVLHSIQSKQPIQIVDLSNLPTGVYLLRAKDVQNKRYSERVLVN